MSYFSSYTQPARWKGWAMSVGCIKSTVGRSGGTISFTVPTGASASGPAEQPAHRLPQDVDAERLDHHRRLRGPDELLVGAAIGVARDEQERRPGRRPPLARAGDRRPVPPGPAPIPPPHV